MRSVAVIGLPDEDRGSIVHAIVEADPGRRRRGRAARLRRRASRPVQAPPHRGVSSTRRCATTAGRCAGRLAPAPLTVLSAESADRASGGQNGDAAGTVARHARRPRAGRGADQTGADRTGPPARPPRAVPLERRSRTVARRGRAVRGRRAMGASVGYDLVPVLRRGAGVVVGPPRRGA